MHKHGGDVYSYPNFIDFSANINFLGVPPAVMEAAKQALSGIIYYPQPKSERLCKAVGVMEQVKPEWVICGNGAADVIFSLVLAEKPKRALLPAPTFQEYEQALLSVDCQVKAVLFSEEDFLNQITEETDMVFFCNPNNPTAILYSREYLVKLLEKCRETDTRLVVDECFLDFVFEAEDITLKPFLAEYPQLFLLKAFTKMFAIPGIRLGYGLSSDTKLLESIRKVTQPWNVSVIAQEAGIAAAKETGFMEESRRRIAEEKQYLRKELKKFPLEIHGDAANFIFFHGEKGLDKKLKQDSILIRNCSNFRGLEEGWYRIAVRSHMENEKLIRSLNNIYR